MSYPADEEGVLDIGQRHFVILNMNGRGGMWWHDCPVRKSGWGWFGQWEDRASGHVVARANPLDVDGSLICTDCRDHGFVRSGSWVPV